MILLIKIIWNDPFFFLNYNIDMHNFQFSNKIRKNDPDFIIPTLQD